MAGLNYIGASGNVRGIPYDAEVEYLESTGTQYLTSKYDIVAGNIFDFEIEFTAIEKISPLSVAVGRNASSWECFIQRNGAGYFGNSRYDSQGELVNGVKYHMVFDLTPRAMRLTLDDKVLKTATGSQTINRGAFPLFITAPSESNVLVLYQYCRIYSFKCYNGTDLVEDFVPVRIGSEGAMYDRVTHKLFRNQGTGSFVVGPDVARPIMGLHFMKPRYTAEDYVQDGLVAMWDGIENAGWGTHDPNATVWKDLMGNSDAELVQGTSVQWEADGPVVNNDVDTSTPYGFKSRSSAAIRDTALSGFFSVEIVFAPVVATRNTTPFGLAAVHSLKIDITASSNYYFGIANLVTRIGNIVSAGGLIQASITKNDSDWHQYSKGGSISHFTRTYSGQYAIVDSVWLFRGTFYTGNDRAASGKMHSFRLYSRALTADEIAANYAVDKARFNLPEVTS